ncbi:MAG: hypothetical protein HY548_00915 [Elusimicrobia bacterium]|nr:hypothetical protein [Elusimicrobiota bacterium]
MSGNKKAKAWDFLDRVGGMAQNPFKALADVQTRPDLPQAVLVVFLTLLARALSFSMEAQAPDPSTAVPQKILSVLISGFFFWIALSWAWHLLSRFFKKEGRYDTLLCLLGWSTIVYWPMPLFALMKTLAPSLGWFAGGFLFSIKAGFLVLAWKSLVINYGWSSAKGWALLFFPLILFAALLVSAAAFFALSLLSGAFLFKVLF